MHKIAVANRDEYPLADLAVPWPQADNSAPTPFILPHVRLPHHMQDTLSAQLANSATKVYNGSMIEGEPHTGLPERSSNTRDIVTAVLGTSATSAEATPPTPEQTPKPNHIPKNLQSGAARQEKREEHGQDRMVNRPGKGVFAVFDGVGGSVDGAKAAQIAADILEGNARRLKLNDINKEPAKDWLERALTFASASITQDAPDSQTTATAVRLVENDGVTTAVWASVGDSRLYHVNGKTSDVTQISQDEGEGKVVTNILGVGSKGVNQMGEFTCEPGDRLLLVTDGITGDKEPDLRTPQELADAVRGKNPDEAAQALVAIATKNDDRTALVVDILALEQSEETPTLDIFEQPLIINTQAHTGSEHSARGSSRGMFNMLRSGIARIISRTKGTATDVPLYSSQTEDSGVVLPIVLSSGTLRNGNVNMLKNDIAKNPISSGGITTEDPSQSILARDLIHGYSQDRVEPTTKNSTDKNQKEKREMIEENKRRFKPIFDRALRDFHEKVKGLPSLGEVRVYRLIRADGLPLTTPPKTRNVPFINRFLYKKTGFDYFATRGMADDGSAATLAEYVRGKEEQGTPPEYKVVEETSGWVVELDQGVSIDSKRLEQLVKEMKDAKGRVTKHIEEVVSSKEEKWLAEILLYGRPMDREAYSALGARGDGTFSRLSVADDGVGGIRLTIIHAANERIIVGVDGRSWDNVNPLVGSDGTAYVVLSDKYNSGEGLDSRHTYPDDLFAKMCYLVAERCDYDPTEFLEQIRSSDLKSNSPAVLVRKMQDWARSKAA